MEIILLVIAPFPLGFFVRSRLVAYVVYASLLNFVWSYQSMNLVLEWVGGSQTAFGPYPHASGNHILGYLEVNLVIVLAGLGLVALGAWLGARRRGHRVAGVNLDPVA